MKIEAEEFLDRLYFDKDKIFEAKNYELGALFGFVVGDALGVPVEFKSRGKLHSNPVLSMQEYGTHKQPMGTWSDDTSLMLCLIAALIEGYSLQKLSENFLDYYYTGKYTPYGEVFDVGRTTIKAIENIKNEIPLEECGGSSERDNGNGSLMRIAPLAYLWDKRKIKDMLLLIEEVSSLTHAHNRSKFACIFYIYFLKQLLLGQNKRQALEDTIAFVNKNCKKYKDEFAVYDRILTKSIISVEEDEIKSTGYVVDSLEAAIWCFMNFHNTKDVLLTAVNLGDDTDTIGAISGALAGAYYGLDSIPYRWIDALAKRDELTKMFIDFVINVK